MNETFEVTRGEAFKKLIYVQERRYHRNVHAFSADGAIQIDNVGGIYPFTVVVSSADGSIEISLTGDQTLDLPLGALPADVAAMVPSSYLGSTQKLVKAWAGTINVVDPSYITPVDEDVTRMQIDFSQGEDVVLPIEWYDDLGALQTVTTGYMQADTAGDVRVLDLRWYATPPNDTAIVALPTVQRGYLSPVVTTPASSFTIFISRHNPIPVGVYAWDIFWPDSAGIWKKRMSGSMNVKLSVSEPTS